MSPKQFMSAIILGAFVLLGSLSAFVVDQREQALVLQFGNWKRTVTESGLHFKFPWQSVEVFDRRLLESDAAPNEVITMDKKTLLVDNYSRWRIVDPLKVYQVARTQRGVEATMQDVIRAKVREVLGQHTLLEIVSGGESNLRAELMNTIQQRAVEEVADLGIDVVDVRIKRADLPKENETKVFDRMKAERKQQAKHYRSQGDEAAKEIRAEAEKERSVVLAEAYKKAQIIRGHADAEATKIYAKAHQKDTRFYSFMRSLEAYKESIGEGTRLVISPDSEFFRYFEQSNK